MQTTDAQQGGEREGEAAEAREAKAAEAPDAKAAEAREPRAAEPGPGGQPDASDDADAREPDDADTREADASDDADAEEPVTAEQAGEREADTAGNLEADQADEADEAAQDQDQVVAERADEAPDAVAEAGEAAPAAADGAVIAADLDAARAEAESYLDDLRRLQADFDNYRKRTLREQTARAASASQALVARLLPVLDNFELAVSAAEQSRDFDRMLKGVEMVFGELREVLQGEGLVKIEAEGKPFDPERHEAVIAVEQEDTEPGTVVDIVRAGYELRGKVLRPAMVKVAK
ncbi:MAG TPA: nucleotide exchange factor GrpE [Actinomycetes bacterium]|nr:nucleotide exchange factor GrpE [Actinomycetes bacterium]